MTEHGTTGTNNPLPRWQNLLSFTYLSFLGLWLIGYIVLLFKVAFAQRLFFYEVERNLHYSDYVLWYVAGQVALSDQKNHLYDPLVLVDYWNRLCAPARMDTAPAFQYPPYFALLFSPFSVMPIEYSFILWTIFSLACGLSGLWIICKKFGQLAADKLPLFLLACAAFYPSWVSFRTGQLVWFYLFLFCTFVYGFIAKREAIAGLTLSILSTKPQYLIFMAIPALVDRRWKILLWAALGEAALLLASTAMFGPSNVFGYPSILFHQETSSKVIGVHPDEMVSMRLVFSLLLPQKLALPVSVLFMFAALILVAAFWYFASKKRELINWAFALTIATAVVSSAHSHVYDSLLLSLAAALTLQTLNLFQALKLEPTALRIWHATFILYPILGCILFMLHEWFPIPLFQSLSMIAMNTVILISGLIYANQLRRSSSD